MGIKRKLSRLWKETRDGILNGPGLSIDDTNLTITEDGGDLVAKDDVGNVVLRYDEASGSWVMDSLKTDDATINQGLTRGRNGERIDVAQYDASDPDSRLDSALSDATEGDVLYLGNETYDSTRTISQGKISLVGTNTLGFGGTALSADITLSGQAIQIQNCTFVGSNTLQVNASRCSLLHNSQAGSHAIKTDAVRLSIIGLAGYSGDVTFQSNASECLIDASADIVVTDNGTNNTVGDIV